MASCFSHITHRALRPTAVESKGLTYANAGVSIDAGNSLVQRIKPFVSRTKRTGSDAEIGGFGGVFDLKATGYQDPVLVSGTDGVGTKLHVAVEAGVHGTVGMFLQKRLHFEMFNGSFQGIDLVAMSVNDLIVQGAEPLYFLDYFACGHLDVDQAASVISGIAEGCVQSGCALIGGETAEMPGMYKKGHTTSTHIIRSLGSRLTLCAWFRRLRFGRVRGRRSRTIPDPPAPRYLNRRYSPRLALLRRSLQWLFVGPQDSFGVRFEVLFPLSVGSDRNARGGVIGTHQDLHQDITSCRQEGFTEGAFAYYRGRFR